MSGRVFSFYTYIHTCMQNFMLFRSRAVSLPDERKKINEKYNLAGNSVELQLKCVQVKDFINGRCKRDHCIVLSWSRSDKGRVQKKNKKI